MFVSLTTLAIKYMMKIQIMLTLSVIHSRVFLIGQIGMVSSLNIPVTVYNRIVPQSSQSITYYYELLPKWNMWVITVLQYHFFIETSEHNFQDEDHKKLREEYTCVRYSNLLQIIPSWMWHQRSRPALTPTLQCSTWAVIGQVSLTMTQIWQSLLSGIKMMYWSQRETWSVMLPVQKLLIWTSLA